MAKRSKVKIARARGKRTRRKKSIAIGIAGLAVEKWVNMAAIWSSFHKLSGLNESL